MSPADLIAHVGTLAARQLPPRVAVAALAPLLAAFVTEPARRWLPPQALLRDDGARIMLNHLDCDFQVVVVPWAAGSRSPIHDHAGAVGAVAALTGATVETKYCVLDENATGARLARVGQVRLCGRVVAPLLPEDGHQLHEMAHAHGEPAATLHVYLRPLVRHDVYLPQADGRYHRCSRAVCIDAIDAWRWWGDVPEAVVSGRESRPAMSHCGADAALAAS